MMAASLRVGGRVMSGTGATLAACALALAPLAVVVPLALAPLFAVTALALLALDVRSVLGTLRRYAALAWLLLLLSAWATVSATWSILPLHSFLEGLRLGLIAAGGLVVLGAAAALAPEDRRRVGAAAAIGIGLAVAMLMTEAVTDGAVTRLLTGQARVPMARFDRAATTLALALWPALLGIRTGGWIEKAALALAVVATIGALESQAAMIAIFAGLGVFALAWYAPRLAAILLAAAMVVSAVALPLATPASRAVVALRHDAPWIKYSGIHRLLIWRFTADRIAERPILGWGMDAARELPGGKTDLSLRFPDAGLPPGSDAMPLHPHNAILQWEVELGAPGTLLSVAIVLWGVWRVGFDLHMPRAARAGAMAWAAAAMVVALLAYGAWQAWWLSSLFLTASLAIAATSAPTARIPRGNVDTSVRVRP